MTTAEILRAALAKLDGGKAWRSEPFGLCGSVVQGEAETQAQVLGALQQLDAALFGMGRQHMVGALTKWNDHPDRTWPEVEALFLRAIAAAEADQ